MKLIIDIPDELYEECKRLGDSRDTLFEAIRQSIPYEERPQGEWITKEHSIDYYCSHCGERLDQCCENFCCHCGADMRVGDKDNKGMREKDWDAYENYGVCLHCVFMSFNGCTHIYHDEISDVNGCVYFADARGERENDTDNTFK